MSSKKKLDSPKFGLMDRLQKPSDQDSTLIKQTTLSPASEVDALEVKFTSYLNADLNRRLQIHVATKKAQKRSRQERVSIKSVLDQAIREYLERHGD